MLSLITKLFGKKEKQPDFLCYECCEHDRQAFYYLIYRAPDGELKCGKCRKSFRVKRDNESTSEAKTNTSI